MSQIFKTNDAQCQKNKNVPLWSIDDDTLFHPLGMKNLCSETKTVIIVWNEDYLLNFIIKKHEQTIIKKVRISLPDEEVIKDLLLLDLNTLLLMQSGCVYYFSSAKSVHIIPWLSGIRSISKAAQVGFSVLRLQMLDKNLQLVLEVYREAVNMAIGHDDDDNQSTSPTPPLVQSFKIPTADLNLFNSSWADESFTLLSVEVRTENINFFVQIIGCEEDDLFEEQILHFFSVSSDFYVLLSNKNSENEFNVQVLNRYVSQVIEIKIMPLLQMCCIFLKCGTVDIWYVTRVSRVLKRFTQYLESPLMSYDFPENSHILYYASERSVLEVKFTYNCHLDIISVTEQRKLLPGILACTWVPIIQQLVCLSWNNIFYQIAFEKTTNEQEDEQQKTKTCINQAKLVSFKMNEITQKAHFINELTHMIGTLKDKLKIENMKRQLLAFTKNCSKKAYFKAHVVFHRQLPNIDNITFYVQNNSEMRRKSIYAVIKLNMLIETEMFKSMAENWNILIDFNGNAHFITNKKLSSQQVLCVELTVKHEQDFHTILDNFSLRLLNFIIDGETSIFLELPIDIEIEQKNYIKEFCTQRLDESNCEFIKCRELLKLYEKETTNNEVIKAVDIFQICYELKISDNAFQYLCNTFEKWQNKATIKECLSIATPKLNMTYNKECKILTLMGFNSIVIYFIKTLLLNYAKEAYGLQHNDVCAYDKIENKGRETLIQHIMTMISKLEQITHTNGDAEDDNSKLFCIESFQMDLLQEMFNKLRKDLLMFTLMN